VHGSTDHFDEQVVDLLLVHSHRRRHSCGAAPRTLRGRDEHLRVHVLQRQTTTKKKKEKEKKEKKKESTRDVHEQTSGTSGLKKQDTPTQGQTLVSLSVSQYPVTVSLLIL